MTAQEARQLATKNSENNYKTSSFNGVFEAIKNAVKRGELLTVYYGELGDDQKADLRNNDYKVRESYDGDYNNTYIIEW